MTFEKAFSFITKGWNREGGYRQVLKLAIPLIFSSAGIAVQQFMDRMFLAWYSPEAIAATMPAGILNFTIINLFVGTAGYVGAFVAQYWGARQNDRIGPILWQGFYVAAIAWIAHLSFIPLAGPFFRLVGHAPEIQKLEVVYFQIICLGAGPIVATAVVAGFFTGRGKPWPVMVVGVTGNIINVWLNYLLVFGRWGLPEMGVKGAAIATLISVAFSFSAFLFLLLREGYEKRYRTLSGWRFDMPLFIRLLRFGLPNGLQFFLAYMGITVFLLLVGRLGALELAATNIAFNINMLAFMPMVGFGMAVMTLVGQYQGKGQPYFSERSVYSGFHLTYIYMTSIALAYVMVPHIFLWPFAVNSDPATFTPIKELITVLLKFVAIYCLFDTMNIICSCGIKGAGDTRFVMLMTFGFSLFGLAIPSYVVLVVLKLGIYAAWTIITLYVIILGFGFLFRFRGGRWKAMRVIELEHALMPDSATAEYGAEGKV